MYTPDIGADEFNGLAVDLSAPSISIASLSTATICTDARTVTATITDASGVSVAAGVKPRLWFKKKQKTMYCLQQILLHLVDGNG